MNAVITGGSKGIGLAIAEKLLEAGIVDGLAICSRSKQEVEKAAAELRSRYSGVTIIADACDVSSAPDVTRICDRLKQEFQSIDLLVNNAGFGKFAHVHEMESAVWNDVISTNLRGVFLMTKALLPSMRKQKRGTIVTISSLAGKNGFVGGAAYCSAKFAVRGLMQSLFLEVREDNVRVVTLFPGSVDTAFFDNVKSGVSMAQKALKAEDVAEAVLTAVRLPIHADVSELDIRPTNPKG